MKETERKIYIKTLLSIRFATLDKLIETNDNVDAAERGYRLAVDDISETILTLINNAKNRDDEADCETNA